MTEKSRTQIAKESTIQVKDVKDVLDDFIETSGKQIAENQKQITTILDTRKEYWNENGKQRKELICKIDKLMELVPLIATIEEIAEEKKTSLAVNKRIAKWTKICMAFIAGAGVVIGTIFAMIELIFRLRK